MPRAGSAAIVEQAHKVLDATWQKTARQDASRPDNIPSSVKKAVHDIIFGNVLTYRYILVTQALAKTSDPRLNALCLQAKSKLKGAFDARSLCKDVVVRFDRANESVLGGSGDPYVSKPARIPEIAPRFRKDQKDRTSFDLLLSSLQFVETSGQHAEEFLLCVLRSVRARLEQVKIAYPVPKRVSATICQATVLNYLSERSGGLRMQAISVALFRTIGTLFALFDEVYSANINAADAATGQVADLECRRSTGDIVLAVEVKDRQLTLIQAQEKVPAIRAKGISEFVFLVQGGVLSDDTPQVEALAEKEFSAGQNIYVTEFGKFLETCLILFGERGRQAFLQAVGEALDQNKSDVLHRRAWRDSLTTI